MSDGTFAGFTEEGLDQLARILREGKRRALAEAAGQAPEPRQWVPLAEVVRTAHARLGVRARDRLPVKVAQDLVEGVFAEVLGLLAAGEKVQVPKFGLFRPATRKARRIRDLQTKELVELPELKSYALQPLKGGLR